MSETYRIVKNKSNDDLEIVAHVNNKKIPMATLKIDKTLKKQNINSYIMTLGEEVTILIEAVLMFARKYAQKHGGMIRIDGEQYVASMRGDVLDPIRRAVSSLTNIYIENNGVMVINTVTKEEVIKLRQKNIDIRYAPMNRFPYKKIYNIYRIFDCEKATISCEKVNEKFSLSPWILIEKLSSMMNKLSIDSPEGTSIHGLAIEDVNGSVKAFSPPNLENVQFEGKFLRLHLTGQSANILETSYEDLREAVGRQIYLSGVDTIHGLLVDMEIFSVLRDMTRLNAEKDTYKKLIEVAVENSKEDEAILPFWEWVFTWGKKEDPDVIAIKCREDDAKGIKTKDLVKFIVNNKD